MNIQHKIKFELVPRPNVKSKYTYNPTFVKTGKLTAPPTVYYPTIYKDTGFASSKYIRSSLNTIDETGEEIIKSTIPFGIVVQPFADPVEDE